MSGYKCNSYYPPVKTTGCEIGNVNQENDADVAQAASITQQVNQSNVFVLICGGAPTPATAGFSFSPTENMNFEFKETGEMVLNGKTIKPEAVADGVNMYVLKETKVKNEKFGNSTPEAMHERVEGLQKEMFEKYDEAYEEAFDDDDEDWEF